MIDRSRVAKCDRPPAFPSEPGGSGSAPDLEAIAATLGVDADQLRQTLEDAGGPNAHPGVVADQLGVTLDALQAALPVPTR